MKQTFFIITFSLTLIYQVLGQTNTKTQSDISTNTIYRNEIYHFSVFIPTNWKLYGQIKNDTVNHKAIADWGLPKVYSELEKTEIENSISITAYNQTKITSIESLIASEYFRINPAETALEVDKSNPNSRIIYTTKNGLEFKGKSYYIYKNGIGYVVTFMATPGTYDKNIQIFEEFYNNININ